MEPYRGQKRHIVYILWTDLNDRVDMDEVKTLDLVGLQPVRTFHAGKHCHYLLSQSTSVGEYTHR